MTMLNAPRVWLERELTAFAASLPAGSVVLDAGAGHQPYRDLFAHCTYETADFEQVEAAGKTYLPSTYVCDLKSIPVQDARFDAVVFTHVMEHLPEPFEVLTELSRVMKPGGTIFYTAPFVYQEHEQPYDFYRYTQYGVRYLLTKARFEIEVLRPLDGTLSMVAHVLRFMMRRLPWKPSDYAPGIRGYLFLLAFTPFRFLARGMAALAARAAVHSRYDRGAMPVNYMAIARKPAV